MLKKKRPIGLILVASTLFTGFIFRHSLLRLGVNLALAHYFPQMTIHYEQVVWQERALVLKNVTIEDRASKAQIEQITISEFSSPQIALAYPVVHLGASQDEPSFAWLNYHLAIPQGKLLCNGEELYFCLQVQDGHAHFTLTYDSAFQNEALLVLDFQQIEEQIAVDFTLPQTECVHLVQLASRFYPQLQEGWEHLEGSVRGSGKIHFNLPCAFDHLELEVEMDDLVLNNPDFHLDANAQHLQVDMKYPVSHSQESPFWERAIASFSLIEGNVHIKDWGLFAKSAHMLLDPQIDPSLQVTGTLFNEEIEYPIELVGKGGVHEDRSFWVELEGHFDKEQEVFVSLCSQEKDAYIVHCQVKEIPWALMQPLVQPWISFACQEGVLSGNCMGFVQNQELVKLHIENAQAQHIVFDRGWINSLQGEALLEKNETWKCTALDIQLEESKFDEWEGKAHLVVKGEEVEPSWFEGKAYTYPLKAQFQGHFADLQGSAQMVCPAPEIPYVVYQPNIEVAAAFKITPHTWQAWGTADQFLSFRLTLPAWQLEKLEGGFRWEEVPEGILPLTGKLSGEGYFNQESIQVTLNGHALHYEGKGFDVTSDTLEGGVFHYNRKTEQWSGSFPFTGGKLVKDSIIFQKGKGTLHCDPEHMRIETVEGEMAPLRHLSCDVIYRFQDGYVAINKGRGEVWTGTQVYPVLVDNLEVINQQFKLDFSLFERGSEIVRVKGQGDLQYKQFEAASESHCFGIKPNTCILSFRNGWCVENLNIEGVDFQGSLAFEGDHIQFPYFKLAHTLGQAEGKMELTLAPFKLTGMANVRGKSPLGEFQTKELVPFHYAPTEGIFASVIKVTIPDCSGEIVLKDLSYALDTQMGKASAVDFSFLFSQISPLPLKGEASVLFGSNDFAAEGKLHPLEYDFAERNWNLNQLQFSLDRTLFNLKGTTQLLEKTLFLSLGVDFVMPHLATLKIRDSLEGAGLKLQLCRGECESIRGSWSGLEMDFIKKNNRLNGVAKLDFNDLKWILPSVNLGEGFTVMGDLAFTPDFNFKGKVVGKECELMGFRVADVETRVECNRQRIKISDLHLGDPAGEFSVKQMKCVREGESWFFEAPLVQVRDFIPSKLRALKGGEIAQKPFLISHFSLFDMQGDLMNPLSWLGVGSMNFINKKKGGSIFDLPLDMLQTLGLEPSLLSPVSGEVECQLKGGKLYLTQLKGSHSEGGHSRFYFSPSVLSYLSLKGELNIDLKMEQNVVLKLMEPLTLKVRGTVDKPKYQLSL